MKINEAQNLAMSNLSKEISEPSFHIFKSIQRASLNWPQTSTFVQACSFVTKLVFRVVISTGCKGWGCDPPSPSHTSHHQTPRKKKIWFLLKRPRINSSQPSCSASPSPSQLFSPKHPDAGLWKQVAVGGNGISISKGLNGVGGGRKDDGERREGGQKREMERREGNKKRGKEGTQISNLMMYLKGLEKREKATPANRR